ncbi:hypothetical protein VVD49_02735 [Uliginosibacterium sp. H3]|uniref:Uncharacterized protein n=1 Tax=Uliginosibacterium silvisoli TaxID=3114758 RepID=A0ABU6JYY0_9RHOO|nr:hypothetical protein [Uliginosibacterium sp. H3]
MNKFQFILLSSVLVVVIVFIVRLVAYRMFGAPGSEPGQRTPQPAAPSDPAKSASDEAGGRDRQ